MHRSHRRPLDPRDAERTFLRMLDESGLPRFASTRHDPVRQELELTWDHGLTLVLDLTRDEIEPLEGWERAAILGVLPPEPIHVYVPGAPDDPRCQEEEIPGVIVHRGPPLHPDDAWIVDGIPVTSPSRTLIDMAECVGREELRELFAAARARGLLDPEALHAARARVEWRPSLEMLDAVIAEFASEG